MASTYKFLDGYNKINLFRVSMYLYFMNLCNIGVGVPTLGC